MLDQEEVIIMDEKLKRLRSEGTMLTPKFIVGKNGLTDQAIKNIKETLMEEKLVKIKMLSSYIKDKNKDIYTLIALNVSIPFYSVGFLAAVSGAIAEKGLNILIVSTFSKDYILIKKSSEKIAVDALLELGFRNKL